MDTGERVLASQPLRTPRAAAVAGILFSALLAISLVLLRVSTPDDLSQAGSWLSDESRRNVAVAALNLVPFAGIAFLWFIGVVRDRIGDREDRFFASVFLGSGLVFVAMMFVAGATGLGLFVAAGNSSDTVLRPDTLLLGRQVTSILLNVYAMRMAAVFMISTATIMLRTRVVSKWIAFGGYAAALVLLFGIGLTAWVELLFPAWVTALSAEILITGGRSTSRSSARP